MHKRNLEMLGMALLFSRLKSLKCKLSVSQVIKSQLHVDVMLRLVEKRFLISNDLEQISTSSSYRFRCYY
jgi:hypothetical protein